MFVATKPAIICQNMIFFLSSQGAFVSKSNLTISTLLSQHKIENWIWMKKQKVGTKLWFETYTASIYPGGWLGLQIWGQLLTGCNIQKGFYLYYKCIISMYKSELSHKNKCWGSDLPALVWVVPLNHLCSRCCVQLLVLRETTPPLLHCKASTNCSCMFLSRIQSALTLTAGPLICPCWMHQSVSALENRVGLVFTVSSLLDYVFLFLFISIFYSVSFI